MHPLCCILVMLVILIERSSQASFRYALHACKTISRIIYQLLWSQGCFCTRSWVVFFSVLYLRWREPLHLQEKSKGWASGASWTLQPPSKKLWWQQGSHILCLTSMKFLDVNYLKSQYEERNWSSWLVCVGNFQTGSWGLFILRSIDRHIRDIHNIWE